MADIDVDATVAAIAVLKQKQFECLSGSDTGWAILAHAQRRLETQLRAYLVPEHRS